MSDFKGTPGPWVVREFPGGWCQPRQFVTDAREDVNGRFVGQLIAAPTTCPDWGANARLIAAAPDLLAEHADAIGYLEEMANSEALDGRERYAAQIRDVVGRMKATQAKATGTGEVLP